MKPSLTIAICISLAAAACSPDAPDPGEDKTNDPAGIPDGSTVSDRPAALPAGPDQQADNDGNPDLTPPPLEPDVDGTETGARNVLLSFARAIELEEFDQAWAMLDETDQAKWPRSQWRRMFADLGEITVAVPGGTMEGAAGSAYYTSRATITAKDTAGRTVRYEGPIVLRRVNDIPGASPRDRSWHIDSVKLDWTH